MKLFFFFGYGFSTRLWKALTRKALILDPSVDCANIMTFGLGNWRGNSLRPNLWKLTLSAVVYHLWLLRNALRHGKALRIEEHIMHAVIWDIRASPAKLLYSS